MRFSAILPVALPLAVALLGSAAACSRQPPNAPPTKAPAKGSFSAAAKPGDPRLLSGQLIAEVPDGTFGPYLGYAPHAIMAVYAPTAAAGAPRKWLAQALSERGAPTAPPTEIAAAPDDPGPTLVRPLSDGRSFLALWSRRAESTTSLEVVVIAADGRPKSKPVIVSQTSGMVRWVDVYASNDQGAVVFWADEKGDTANVLSARVDTTSTARPATNTVAQGLKSWQVAPSSQGYMLAGVRMPTPQAGAGIVIAQPIDANGRSLGTAAVVNDRPSAMLDVDIAAVGASLVIAWTDRRDTDSRVYLAAVDASAKVTSPPHPLGPTTGDQALLALVGSKGHDALLAIEDMSTRSRADRSAHLKLVDEQGRVGDKTLSMPFAGGESENPDLLPTPLFATAPDGFAALVTSPGAERTPSWVRMGHDLSIRAGNPVRVEQLGGASPSNLWALGCTASWCGVLATTWKESAPIWALGLPASGDTTQAPAVPSPPRTPPFLTSNEVVHEVGDTLMDFDVARVGDKSLAAWVTWFVDGPKAASQAPAAPRPTPKDAPGDPKKPTAAHLAVLPLDGAGAKAGPLSTISIRASSAGGVAIAAGAAPNKDACLAWVARDEGDQQVFVTRVNDQGKRDAQQMLTRAKGDAADTAIAWVGDGWVVAWVDWRDGNGEVYAAKVDRALRKVVQDTRLTQAPGDASDVALLVRGDEIVVAYADARENAAKGVADPYAQRIRVSNLTRIGEESRLDYTPMHARALRLAAWNDDVIAAWIDAPPQDLVGQGTRSGLRLARLDAKTLGVMGPVLEGRPPEASWPGPFALTCDTQTCRIAASLGSQEQLRLGVAVYTPRRSEVTLVPVTAVAGPPTQDIAPLFLGDAVLLVDQPRSSEMRVRRAQLTWR